MVTTTVAWIVAGLVVAGVIFYAVGVYNTFVRLARLADQSFANIDSVLRQRHDEIPKLVNACEAYMAHERGVLTDVTTLRAKAEQAEGTDEKVKAENQLARMLGKLRVMVEAYPDLKASQNFLQAQERMSAIETTINDRREHFNAAVTEYNTYIAEFPALVFAPTLGFRGRSLLEIAPEERIDQPRPFGEMPRAKSPATTE